MLNLRHSQHGITLVELMIGLVIVGILFALAVPAYNGWIQNQKIRTAAESLLNGIQLARNTAVTNNTQARFALCDSASSWQVLVVSAVAAPDAADTVCGAGAAVTAGNEVRVQERSGQEGSASVAVLATSINPPPATIPIADDGSRSITFNGFGRVVANDPAVGGTSISAMEVAVQGGNRQLLVTVRTGGSVRMCDPSLLLAATDPRHC